MGAEGRGRARGGEGATSESRTNTVSNPARELNPAALSIKQRAWTLCPQSRATQTAAPAGRRQGGGSWGPAQLPRRRSAGVIQRGWRIPREERAIWSAHAVQSDPEAGRSVSRSREMSHGRTRDRYASRSEILCQLAGTRPRSHQTSRGAGTFARSSSPPSRICAAGDCSDEGDPLPVDLLLLVPKSKHSGGPGLVNPELVFARGVRVRHAHCPF